MTPNDAIRVPDVHCHLESLRDPPRAVQEAVDKGVGPILAVGMEQGSSERTLAMREQFPGVVLAAVGLHPSEIPGMDEVQLRDELDFVRETLASADALGEVGLDYKDARDERQRARQREALELQLEWAARLRKPVSMHSRRAEHEVVESAASFASRTGLGVNLHWFTHSIKMAKLCADAGVYISPGPSILSSDVQAEVARAIAPELLLLETDSPVEYEGEAARPAWAARVAARLAELRGEPLESLAERLQVNLRRYLGQTA